VRDLEADLAAAVAGEVRFDVATRAAYASDASNFRQPPIGVVIPASIDDVVATHRVCHAHRAPLLPRGCGTGLSGAAVNRAVVIDFTKHLDAVLGIDPVRRLARVQPGAVNDRVGDAAAPHGLRFGPDPATHAWCTIGGNIATNACGVHSLQARFDGNGSRTSDNVERLEVLTYDGLRMWVGPTPDDEIEAMIAGGGRRGQIYHDLRDLRDRHAGAIRQRFPAIPRRVSGYNLDELLPERGFNLAAALAGTEGTCVTFLEAELRLIPQVPARTLMVVGYDDIFGAADHVTEILEARPIGCECFDHALVRSTERRLFPEGAAWAFVELGGDTTAESDARALALAERLRRDANPPRAVALIDDPARARRLWEVREAGLAASSRPPGEADHYPGWEDAAVAPEDLGRYLRGLRDLYDRFGYTGAFYGHLGDGCIHSRANFDLMSPAGLAAYRAFIEEAADLVVSFGGSLSGEHGDGQQRAELLPKMFGDELVAAFGEFKAIWDPDGGMNPGKVVNPRRLDQDLRVGARSPRGGFAVEVQRCVGVGKCRRPDPGAVSGALRGASGAVSGALRGASGGVMCPSFAVTRDEQHSTRGRARLLFEMLQGDVVRSGWRSPEVAGALDLCLACKGCTSECPAGVDLPSYKAEFLHHHYRGRVRPRHTYAFGLIDQVARVGSKLPGLANRVAASRALKLATGMAPERPVPALAAQTLQQWFVRRRHVNPDGPRVMLWPDTFSNYFDPSPAIAAVEAMEAAGWRVLLPEGHACCGRPLYDYGFLGLAERYLRRVLKAVGPALAEGLPVVGVEPSCVATLRHELPGMLPRDDEALALSRQAMHFGEFFERYGIEPPRAPAPGLRAHLWIHCHQKATGGGGPDRRLLEAMGAEVVALPGTCCGLAGSWGMEAAHHDLSVAIGERDLLPAVREAGPGDVVVANGFSCRMQIEAGTGRRALHLAEVMAIARQRAR
jgi:FAD/FMN-containing dehydrogenase/Fe-S oxidoreductase